MISHCVHCQRASRPETSQLREHFGARPAGCGKTSSDMSTDTHKTTIAVGKIRDIAEGGFTGPAYRPADYEIGERWGNDYTGENRAAHGCISVTQEESKEGRQRTVCVNGNHLEVGPWSPTRANREAREKRETEREAAKAKAEAEALEDKAAKDLGISVVSVSGDVVECQTRDGYKTVRLADIREAARDPWHPRLTREQALAQEPLQDRVVRLAYRHLLRRATDPKTRRTW